MTKDLVAFVEARLADDEATARRVLSYSWEPAEQGRWEDWKVVRDVNNETPPFRDDYVVRTKLGALRPHEMVRLPALANQSLADHVARFGSPARVLRELQARRRRLARFARINQLVEEDPVPSIIRNEMLSVRRALLDCIQDDAAVWADHPDYRAEWVVTNGGAQ